METKPAWIAIWLNLVLLLVTYRYAESTSTLSTNRRPVQTLELKLICTDSGQITSDVNFYKGGTLQGGCIPNCGSGISGYAINQDKSGGVTNLTIISVDVTRDAGNWTCLQVGSTDSKAVEIRQDLSNNIPPSSIVVKPSLTTTLTSLDGITNITASMPCAKLNPAYRWSYTQDSSKITVTGTDDSEQGACSTGEKIYSSTFLISTLQAADVSGTIVLQLEVEYDSFDPPTYTETFSSGNIVFGVSVCDGVCTYVGGVFCGVSLGSYIIYTIVIKAVPNKIKVLQVFFVITMTTAGFSFVSGIACTGVTGDRMNSCEGLICDRDLGLSIASLLVGLVIILIKIFIQGMVMDSAGVCKRSLLGNFLHFPSERDAAPNNPRATANTPATVETIREASSGNSRGNGNQETIPLTKDTTNSQEIDERKDGNKETPALGQGNTQTGDRNGGQTETSKSENGEKKKGSKKKKKSKKKRENQDGSQSPPAVSVSGVDVDQPKTAEEPVEQMRSESNLTKVVG